MVMGLHWVGADIRGIALIAFVIAIVLLAILIAINRIMASRWNTPRKIEARRGTIMAIWNLTMGSMVNVAAVTLFDGVTAIVTSTTTLLR